MMTTNLFVIVNVKPLRTGGCFLILLPFFLNILGCCRPKFSNFLTVFTIQFFLARFWRAFGIWEGGGFEPPQTLPRYATVSNYYYLVTDIVTWFETRSEICSAEREAKLLSEELRKYLDIKQ